MNLFVTGLIGIVASVATFAGAYKYMPLSWLDSLPLTFGSTITTINGSDTLSASPSVINTNFSNLNTDKLQSGDTAAALTITTLTNTTLTGTTGSFTDLTVTNPLAVASGGTGSTTLSQYQVLLGSTTNAVSVVSGLGTSGQFLTSNGAGAKPSWTTSAVDQRIDYNRTANHNFTWSTRL